MNTARFTRRHWGREFVGAYKELTGPFRGASGKYSMFRIMLAAFAIQFVRFWPNEWAGDAVIALALILFALPVDALFSRVPVAESLAALTAFFSSVMGRAGMTSLPATVTTERERERTSTTVGVDVPSPRAVLPEDA